VINGTKYPNFLLFHPRDHISWWASHPHLDSQEARRNKLSPSISMREFVATGCKETGDDHAPYVCPSSVLTPNPGVTKATKLADYTKLSIDHVNSKRQRLTRASDVATHTFSSGRTLGFWQNLRPPS
jgi:hypothetical protein